MTLYRAVEGDNKTPLPATLDGVDDLTGATIVAHLKPINTGGAPHSLDVNIIDGTAGTVKLEVDTADTVAAGLYQLEWQATFPDTTVLTWPTKGVDYLLVRSQLA